MARLATLPGSIGRITGFSRSSSSRLRSSRSLISPIACSAESRTSNAARGTVAGILLPHQHLGPAVDRRERVAQLVVHHREEPLARAVQLLHLLQQAGALLVQPGVLHHGGDAGGQQHGDVLVLVGEQRPAELLGEVEVAEHPRRPTIGTPRKECIGGWWGGSRRIGMPRQVGQPDRPRLPDHQSENAVAPGQLADAGPQLLVNPVGGEALQQPAVGRQHPDRGVVRPDELGGRLDDVPQDAI